MNTSLELRFERIEERFSPLPACRERAAEGSKPAQQARVRGRRRRRRRVGEGASSGDAPSPPLRFAPLVRPKAEPSPRRRGEAKRALDWSDDAQITKKSVWSIFTLFCRIAILIAAILPV